MVVDVKGNERLGLRIGWVWIMERGAKQSQREKTWHATTGRKKRPVEA